MKSQLLIALSFGLMLAFCSSASLAQTAADNWGEVQKLQPDSKLQIKTKAGQKYNGKVRSVTADAITLSLSKTASQDVELKREEIAEIRQKSGARVAGYAALFGGLGAAGGYGIGYGVGEAKEARFAVEYPMALFGAAIGAGVGAFIGSRGAVIYRAR